MRERAGDMIYLLEHFRLVANDELGKSVNRFSPESIERLQKYDWPGNVREFQSVVRRSVLQTTGKVVIPDFLPKFGATSTSVVAPILDQSVDASLKAEIESLVQQKIQSGESDVYDVVIERVERELITQVLEATQGNQAEAAGILGITRTTLRNKIKKLGIQINRSIATRVEVE